MAGNLARGHGTPLRVGVIADWEQCSRGLFWDNVLTELQPQLRTELTIYRVADRVGNKNLTSKHDINDPASSASDESDISNFFVQDCDVLIVNWDAINGDPDFGADFALRWIEHRLPEILIWVRNGGILIIEGQAKLSIPCQSSYDAILGASELAVSGPENELNPVSSFFARTGKECRMTNEAKSSELFDSLDVLYPPENVPKHEDMFPGPAEKLLVSQIRLQKWDCLYRGWFRLRLFSRMRMRWVPLVKTVGRKWDHPVMLVARHGRGAVFASTMLLASTRQVALIEALLKSSGAVGSLPKPRIKSQLFSRQVTQTIWPPLAGGVATYAVAEQNPLIEGGAEAAVVVAGIVGFAILGFLLRLIFRLVKEITG